MDFQQFVTQRLASLTASVNSFNLNAKKIDDLPKQNVLDPASRIHVSRGGISERIDIQQLIDSIKDNAYNQVIFIGEITLVGNEITIPANAIWKINNVIYGNTTDIKITIPYANSGLGRKDILVADRNNKIYLVKGDETSGITFQPTIPINTVVVTELDITDNSIGNPTTPEPGSNSPIPYLTLRLIAKGVGNSLVSEQPGDIFEGFKDATTYWTRARWNGGNRGNRNNYTPIVEHEL